MDDFWVRDTVQNGDFRNFIFNEIDLLRDFLMQYIVSGYLCTLYACLKALEPKCVICLPFKLFLHCRIIATCILMPFAFHNDHFYIFHAKFLSTGLARQFESWDNTYFVFSSLCLNLDVLINGLLKMSRHPMLYSFNVNVMNVLLQSDENKCANIISKNSLVFAFKRTNNSVTVDLISLCNTVDFAQKLQALLFQIYKDFILLFTLLCCSF